MVWSQDSDMMYNCLEQSIATIIFAKVSTETDHSTFIVGYEEVEDDHTFLKLLWAIPVQAPFHCCYYIQLIFFSWIL